MFRVPPIDPDPAFVVVRPSLVRREIVGLIPLFSDSPSVTGDDQWAHAPPGAVIRGLVVTHLNVRIAQMMGSIATEGSRNDLPVYAEASYAISAVDREGLSNIYAFGGVDHLGGEQAALFEAKPGRERQDDPSYSWQRLVDRGVGPSPRTRAALALGGDGTRVYVFGGRAGNSTLDDLWAFDLRRRTWQRLTLSSPISAREDAGMTARGNELYIGGGAPGPMGSHADLFRVDGLTGEVVAFGDVLSKFGRQPQISFDDHGDGLLVSGGYLDNERLRDVWHVTPNLDSATVQFVWDFAQDGLIETDGFAVVGDFEHRMFWGVPGFSNGLNAQGVWFFDGANTTVIPPGGGTGGGGAPLRLGARVGLPERGVRALLPLAERQSMVIRTGLPSSAPR